MGMTDSNKDDVPASAPPKVATRTQTLDRPAVKPPVPWNVVLLDDQDHSYDYVIRMVRQLFHMSEERAYQVAKHVDAAGRAVCLTTHKEHAELKRDQVLGYGPDPLIAACKGSMSCVIEPAEFDGDDSDGDDRGA